MGLNWDERFQNAEFVYGQEPNAFLVSVADRLPAGPILSLAEGEGRNAVYLAGLGHDVLAVDGSAVGLSKAKQLAEKRNVKIRTQVADLSDFNIEPGAWAGIVSIFGHLPPQIRMPLYASVVNGLRPGGVFILEAYSPDQCGRGTGGPSDPDMMPSLEQLKKELHGLQFQHATELERDVSEGKYHTGLASVVQIVAIKPQ